MLTLHHSQKSSASYRVRVALALKGIDYRTTDVPIFIPGADQERAEYKSINPQGLVPSLEMSSDLGGDILTQSLAIVEYLDEKYPNPPLLPAAPEDRARVRAMAYAVAMEVQPLQGTGVLNHLREAYGQTQDTARAWAHHWIRKGLGALQDLIARAPVQGRYCYGDQVTLADLCLAPQMVNVRRLSCPVDGLDRLVAIDRALQELPVFNISSSEIELLRK